MFEFYKNRCASRFLSVLMKKKLLQTCFGRNQNKTNNWKKKKTQTKTPTNKHTTITTQIPSAFPSPKRRAWRQLATSFLSPCCCPWPSSRDRWVVCTSTTCAPLKVAWGASLGKEEEKNKGCLLMKLCFKFVLLDFPKVFQDYVFFLSVTCLWFLF